MLDEDSRNGFEKHRIDHSSASAINLYANAPHMWVAQYLFQKRSEFGSAAKAGVLVEDAVTNVIGKGWTLESAITSAVDQYQTFITFDKSETAHARGEAMVGMITGAIEALKPFGDPEFNDNGKQKKIELLCNGNGWQLPIHGYIDYHFPKHGLIIDLKSTMKMPSGMSIEHKRQSCIYRKAMDNQTVKFMYVTGKRCETFECEDVSEVLADVKHILNRQEALLRSGDRSAIRDGFSMYMPHNSSTFYHDDNISREIFGV